MMRGEMILGSCLPSLSRHFTLDAIKFRYRPGSDYHNLRSTSENIHNDAAAAAAEGLPAPVASAPGVMALAHHQMVQYFGASWFTSGRASLLMKKAVYAGDFVTSQARLVRKELEAGRVREVFQITIKNQKGVEVVVGEASSLAKGDAIPDAH